MSDTSNDGLDFASSNTPANAWVPQRQVKAIDMANNVKIVAQSNPYLAQNPDLLRTIASSSNDPYQLSATSGAFGGMMAMDKLQSTFKRMSPGSQRALYGKLSDSQQRGLAEFGYQPPEDEDSAFGNFIETIAKPVKYALGGPAQLAMHTPGVGPAISMGLEGFAWVSDQTAHFYRAIRTMDTADQWIAAGGAAVGIAGALLLAPETAGASLAALSPLGFGALTGATAAAALTNHEDWWRAYKNSFDGERTFTQRSRDRALELVGNPMLKTMAVQIADSGFNIDDFLLEVGGQRNAQNQNTQLNAAFTMANKLASPGSAENKMIAGVMVDLMQQPLFQEAVLELQKGKISLGRDVARWVGADYGSREYNFISGGIDAVWQIAMDPTLVAGYGYKVYEAQRLGFRGLDGAAAYSKLVEIEGKEAGVLAMHQKLLDAVNNNDFEMIRRYSATTSELFMPLHNYRNQLIDAANGQAVELTIDHWHTWLDEVVKMEPLLKGMGTKKGVRDAVILDNLSPVKQVAKEVTSKLRSFNYGLTDIRREKEYLSRLAGQQTLRGIRAGENATATGTINALRKLGTGMTSEQMMRIFTDAAELNPAGFGAVVPAEFVGDLMQSGLIEKPWLYKEANIGAREAGRKAAKIVPPLGQVGEFVTRISTLMPQRGSIALTGPRAPTDVRALTEIGQMTGMPEYTRRMWRDLIMSTTDPGQRSLAINSFLDDMLTMGGARTTEYGSQLTDEFLKRTRHIYAGGNIDEVLDPLTNVGRTTGLFDADQAVEMVIPNLSELRKITTTNFAATLLGILDESRYGAAINNIWKPAVLLRVGFIMRAGGEEGFNFMLRGGFGRIGQTFGADSLAQYEVWKEAEQKIATNWTLPEESRLALSIEEQAAHARGPMPTHLRPFVHRMDQWGWTKPTSTYFENYRRFIHDSLDRGLGFNPPMLAEAKWQGLPKAGHLGERFGQNVENITNALLFGSQYSWRRMVLGGVSDDLIETALAYERHYKTVMAREVGAMETGDWAQDRDTREIQEVWLKDQHGTERPTPVVVDYTRHQFVIPGAEGHAQAKLANARKPLEDERFRKAALPIVGTVVPPRLVAHDVVDQLEAIRALPFELRKLAYEAIGTTSRDHVLRTIERLDVPEVLKQELKDLIPRIGEEIPWDDILAAVDKSVKTSTGWLPEQLGVQGRGAGDVMRQSREFVASLTNDERGAFNNLMRGVDPAGGHLDINFDELRAQIDNVPYSPQQRAASTRPPAKSRDQLRREQAALQQRMDNLVVPNRVDPAPAWTPEQSARYDELRSDLQAWDEWETEGAHIDDVHTQEAIARLEAQKAGLTPAQDYGQAMLAETDKTIAETEARAASLRAADQGSKADALEEDLVRMRANREAHARSLERVDQPPAAATPVKAPPVEVPAEWQSQIDDLTAKIDDYQARVDAGKAELEGQPWSQRHENLIKTPQTWVDEYTAQRKRIQGKIEGLQREADRKAANAAAKAPHPTDDVLDRLGAKLDQQATPTLAEPELAAMDPERELRRYNKQLAETRDQIAEMRDEGDWGDILAQAEDEAQFYEEQIRLLTDRVSHAAPPSRTRKQIQDEMDALQSHLEQTTPSDRDFARYQAQQISLRAQMDVAADNLRKWDQYDAAVMVQDPRYAELQNQMVPLKAHRDQLQAQYDAIEADLSRRMQNQKRYDPDSARQAQRVRKRDAVRDELRRVDGELAQLQSEMGSRAQFMGDPSVPKVLHTSLDDVRGRVVDDLAAQFRGTRSVPSTPLSERAKRDLSDQSTRVYGTSYLPPVADVDQAFQDMVITATRPDLVRANEVTIKSWMTAEKGQRVLVADPVLAEQMTDFARRLSPTPRAIESVEAVVPWSIVDNPNIGILAPLDRGEHKATAWTLAQDKADQMGLRPMKFTSDEWDASYDWAERQFDYMRYEWGHGVRSVQVPRSRPVAGKPGERETGLRIASADRKSYVPVDPTDRFVDNRVFLDSTDQRVSVTDRQFFNSEWVNEGMESKPMWAMLGPMIEDLSDESLGMATYLGKENMSFHAGDIVPSTDVVRRFRSSHRDLEKVEGGVDSFARREMRHEVEQDSLWKRLTRWGFDRVIGPSLEAIIRKPMAMHFFHERYQFATAMNWWRVDQGAKDAVDNVLSKVYVSADQLPPKELYELLHETRNLAVAHGEPTAAKWTNSQTAAWLRAHEPDEIRSMAEQLQRRTARGQRTAKRGGDAWKQHQLNAQTARRMLAHDETVFKAVLAPATTPEDFIALVRSQLDPDSLRSVEMATRVNKDVIENHPILKNLDHKDWDFVITLHKNLASIEKEAGDYAAIAAIGDMMPFIDSHELRSQFAQVVKPLMPFWYAEENFLKRWARTVLLDPTSIRKGQLVIQGLKNAGVVRTDESGKQWFVYPGGQIFADLFKWVPGVPDGGPLDTMFQTPLDQMLPGINGNFGAPSFSPTVTIGMDLMTNGFQELAPLERAVSGDLSASRSAWRHLVPSFLVNTMEAMFSKQTDRMANAMMTSMALQDAYGIGLDDNATEGEIDAYLDRTRSQARILSVSQALLQFLTPGPPTAVQDKEQPFFAIGGIDPTSMFKNTYATMIKQFGIEDGTARYLQIYPEHTLNDIIDPNAKVTGYDRHEGIVNPVALTTSQSESTSGAPVQPTEAALAFYNDNRAFMEEFPNAGPWLLPQDDKGQRVAYVQDQQYAVGLRQRRTPEEFLRALKFKQASGLYFAQRDEYLNFVDLARERGDEQAVRNANDAWSQWADIYKTNNRIFREELEFGDGRKTRARVLDEMRIAVLDPAGPQSEHMPEMRKLMGEYDKYKLELQSVANDSTKAATQYKEDLKVAWETWAQEYVTKNPTVQGFWLSILRPESGLE